MEIPTTVTKTLYACVGIGEYVRGDITIRDYKSSDDPGDKFGHVIIKEFEVTVDLPKYDVTADAIQNIESAKEQLKQETHNKLCILDQQIQELLALPAPECV